MFKAKFEKGFVETVENHKSLLYADTDSLYICAQNRDPKAHGEDFEKLYITDKNDKEQWSNVTEQAMIIAKEINDEIGNQLSNDLGKRAGLDPDFQSIFFKTELVALRMMQFDVKKTYAILYYYDEGKIVEHPVIKKTGGQISKSSTPRISREILSDIYNNMMYTDVTSVDELKHKIFSELYQEYLKKFKSEFDVWNFKQIGLPYKYGFGKNMTKWIWGALFFNTFFNDELRPGTSMYSLYILFDQNKLLNLLNKTDHNSMYKLQPNQIERKWDMISVPVELGEEFFETYKNQLKYLYLEIDLRLAWDHNKDVMVDKKFMQFKTFF